MGLLQLLQRGFSGLRKSSYYTVSLIGRPNVGKSTLFNRLVGRRASLVDDMPGLTRDRIESISNLHTDTLFDVPIKFVDTAGWEPQDTSNSPSIVHKMIHQTRQALLQSNLALFLLDCKTGLTAVDMNLARWLLARRKEAVEGIKVENIVLVANKAEGKYVDDFENRVFKLGLGEPIYISAAQGDGMVDLYERIRNNIPESYFEEQEQKTQRRSEKFQMHREKFRLELEELEKELGEAVNQKELLKEFDALNPSDMSELDSDSETDPRFIISRPSLPSDSSSTSPKVNKPIQMSIIGRQNVGKSTLVNALLSAERVIADQLPGTTRDCVYTELNYKGRNVTLVDTAGLVRHPEGKISEQVKEDVMKAVKYSQIVVLLFDSMTALSRLDLDLARLVIREGRALILAGNKWDLVVNKWRKKAADYIADQARTTMDIKDLPMVFLSAKECSRINDFMDLVLTTYTKWNRRISTGHLNRWLSAFKKVQNLPSGGGEKLNIKYMAQIKSRPPTFYIYVNNKELMKDNYLKKFRNALCREFGLEGVAVRLLLRDKQLKMEKKPEKEKLKPGFFVNLKEKSKLTVSELYDSKGNFKGVYREKQQKEGKK